MYSARGYLWPFQKIRSHSISNGVEFALLLQNWKFILPMLFWAQCEIQYRGQGVVPDPSAVCSQTKHDLVRPWNHILLFLIIEQLCRGILKVLSIISGKIEFKWRRKIYCNHRFWIQTRVADFVDRATFNVMLSSMEKVVSQCFYT